MTKIKGLISAVLLFTGIFSSCTQEGEKMSVLSVNALLEVPTKGQITSFADGDQIGLLVTDLDGGNYDNCDCSFNVSGTLGSGIWSLNGDIVLLSPASVYAYYPYNSTVTDGTAVPVEAASQTDYLYAEKGMADVNNPVVTFKMKHALALLKFSINKDNYTGIGKITQVSLKNIGTSGKLNAYSGEITSVKQGNETYKCNYTLSESDISIGAIVLPSLTTGTIVVFTIDGTDYTYEVAPGVALQGKENVYALTINQDTKTMLNVGSVVVESWGKGEAYAGNLANNEVSVDTEILSVKL